MNPAQRAIDVEKEDWILIICVFLFLICSDQFTKQAYVILEKKPSVTWGPFKLEYVENQGLMAGTFENLPPEIKTVTLSTIGTFLIGLFFALQYLLPIRSIMFRLFITFLFGGFIGNVIDRSLHGYVIDFLTLSFVEVPVWNVADMYQWLGAMGSLFYLTRFSSTLWPDNEKRNRKWIDKAFQLRFLIIYSATSWALGLILWVFSSTFIKASLQNQENYEITKHFLQSFSIGMIGILLTFNIFILIFGLLYSHRIAGPVYAIRRYFRDRQSGKDYPFKLRTGDEFSHLEEFAQEITAPVEKK